LPWRAGVLLDASAPITAFPHPAFSFSILLLNRKATNSDTAAKDLVDQTPNDLPFELGHREQHTRPPARRLGGSWWADVPASGHPSPGARWSRAAARTIVRGMSDPSPNPQTFS
jgi:hypothetical protein